MSDQPQNQDRDLESLLDEALSGFEETPAENFVQKEEKNEKKNDSKLDAGRIVLEDALKMLAQNQNAPLGDAEAVPTDEDLEKMFAEFSMAAGAEPAGEENLQQLLPVMESMMESLLSKELLYPPLKELAGKYPDWLADHRSDLTESEFDNYNKQFEVTKKICLQFEASEAESDGKMSKANFDKVFELMQEMQSHGHPPKELVGDMPSSPFSQDFAKEQCVIA